MPIGSYASVPLLADTLLNRRPKTILDLGMGFGGGGVVVREWLDLGITPWKTFLAGVEAWADYRNPVWDLYNVVYIETIESFLSRSTEEFECVLLGDVIEHFDKAKGQAVLQGVKRKVAAEGCLLVTTPAKFATQDAVYGNEWERHRSLWTDDDFTRLAFHVERAGRKDFHCGECLFAQWRNCCS